MRKGVATMNYEQQINNIQDANWLFKLINAAHMQIKSLNNLR